MQAQKNAQQDRWTRKKEKQQNNRQHLKKTQRIYSVYQTFKYNQIPHQST